MIAERTVVGWLEILKARNLEWIDRGPSRACATSDLAATPIRL